MPFHQGAAEEEGGGRGMDCDALCVLCSRHILPLGAWQTNCYDVTWRHNMRAQNSAPAVETVRRWRVASAFCLHLPLYAHNTANAAWHALGMGRVEIK